MAVFQLVTTGIARFGQRVSRNVRSLWDSGPIEFILRVLGAGGATSWVASFTLPMLGIPFVNLAVVGVGLIAAGLALWHYMGQIRKTAKNDLENLKTRAKVDAASLKMPEGFDLNAGIEQQHAEGINQAKVKADDLTPTNHNAMKLMLTLTNDRQFKTAQDSLNENLEKYCQASNELTASNRNRVMAVQKLFALSSALENAENIPAGVKVAILQQQLISITADVQNDIDASTFKRPSTLLNYLEAAKAKVVGSAKAASKDDQEAYAATAQTIYKSAGLLR